MYFVQGRPRYWESGYDNLHLAAPVLALVTGLLIAVLPAKPVVRARPVPQAPARIVPTTILAPTSGATLTAGEPAIIEGLAQPGGVVRLYWYSQPIGEPTLVGRDGRWRFSIGGLPAGTHSIRAGALVAGRHLWSGETVFTAAPKAPPKSPARTGSGTKPASRGNRSRP